MFRAGAGGESLVFASFGAAVMGIWSSTSTSAGSAMQRERWHGTLELLVTAPVHFAAILLPVTVAMSALGLYSMTRGLLEPDDVRRITRTMPLRKVAQPEDVAAQVVVLASERLSGHVTGELVTVAGGMEGRVLHAD